MTAIDCPVCHAPFKEMVNEGVLIDVCTECKGIWLDRGELEKLIDVARTDFSALDQQDNKTKHNKSIRNRYLESL